MRVYVARLILVSWPLVSPAAAEPTGDSIVAGYVEKIGGASAVSAVQSFHASGPYVLEAPALEGTLRLDFARPDKLLFQLDLPAFGKIARGYDGVVGWELHPQLGNRILEGADLDHLKTQAMRGFSLLPSVEMFHTVTRLGVTDFDGRKCHEVRLAARHTGFEYVEYFDEQTGLLAGRVENAPSPQGVVKLSGTASGYRKFGKLTIPTIWTHEAAGLRWRAEYETFTINETSDDVFALPEEIQALLDAREAPATRERSQ